MVGFVTGMEDHFAWHKLDAEVIRYDVSHERQIKRYCRSFMLSLHSCTVSYSYQGRD